MFTTGPSVTINPFTGSTTCPAGFIAKMVGHFCASVTDIPGYGCYLYYCYKL